MIVVDTSALMAVLLNEAEGAACAAAMEEAEEIVISAGMLAEALVVAARRGVGGAMTRLVTGLGFRVVDVTEASAQRVAAAYARWGRGVHAAGLSFWDCFAYKAAVALECRLLFVGRDFAAAKVFAAVCDTQYLNPLAVGRGLFPIL